MNNKRIILVLCFVLSCVSAFAYEPGELFEPVVDTLKRKFFYRDFRTQGLPELAAYWRPTVQNSKNLSEEEAYVREFLSMIPVSHLALLSEETYQTLNAELNNKPTNTLGFGVTVRQGNYYACSIMEQGPADQAGLQRWDRIIKIQNEPVAKSRLLDMRSDDAALPDPPVHRLHCWDEAPVQLIVKRADRKPFKLEITPESYSAYKAARNSACIYSYNDIKIGYIHFWYMHMDGIGPALRTCIEKCKEDCQGFVLDIRGRGGYSVSNREVLDALRSVKKHWKGAVAIVIDKGTRSAKEILAYEIKKRRLGKLIGETTAGAVLPAGFHRVGNGKVLMYPIFSHGSYSAHRGTAMSLADYSVLLEGNGVRPHIEVEDSSPKHPEGDPILDAALDYISRSTNDS